MHGAGGNQTSRELQVGSVMSTVTRASSINRSQFGRKQTQRPRQSTSVPPLTKSIYGRVQGARDQPKTFYKGAVSLLASEKHHTLGNHDVLKKILDDRQVLKKYNETIQHNKEQEFKNSGYDMLNTNQRNLNTQSVMGGPSVYAINIPSTQNANSNDRFTNSNIVTKRSSMQVTFPDAVGSSTIADTPS